jgi:hypothetical protein
LFSNHAGNALYVNSGTHYCKVKLSDDMNVSGGVK